MIDGVDVEGTVGDLLSGVPEYVWNGEKPVSYTHLDVYKRQVKGSG